MKSISNIISHILTVAFGIIAMPIFVLMAVIFPLTTISEIFKVISTGYTVNADYITYIIGMTTLLYLSLRVRAFRRLYVIFPSLYEFLKYLTISYIFIGTGAEILNWSYMDIDSSRHLLGIAALLFSLILWRVFVSIYYMKRPVSKVMFEKGEKLNDYSAG